MGEKMGKRTRREIMRVSHRDIGPTVDQDANPPQKNAGLRHISLLYLDLASRLEAGSYSPLLKSYFWGRC
jgi:hypothetical protein